MKILDRYCAKAFMKYFAISVISCVLLYTIIDFFERIRMFLSNHATMYQMVSFFFFSIPMITWQVLPACVLIASLVTFGSLSKNNELVAMKACGVSIYRMALPIVAISALISIITFLISEFVTPYANHRADCVRLKEIQKQETAGVFKQNQIWYRGKAGIYNFKVFDPRANILQGITLYYLDKKFNLVKRIDAERAEWRDGRWVLYNLITVSFPPAEFPDLTAGTQEVADLPENPDNFKTIQKNAENMGYLELRKYIREIQSDGFDATAYLVDMHAKLAFPLVNIIMAIIGIASSIKLERKGGMTQGIAAGIVIGFSYWIVFAFNVSLGHAGGMPPLLSAWAANILFVLGASFLFLRVRT
jgi:lipopolysaccharide export system permease protein